MNIRSYLLLLPLLGMFQLTYTTKLASDSTSSSDQPDPIMAQSAFIDRPEMRQHRALLYPAARKHIETEDFWFDAWLMPGGYANIRQHEFGRYFMFANADSFTVGDITTGNSDFAAAQLGLALDYPVRSFLFKPVVHKFVANTGLTIGFDRVVDGMYFAAYVPVEWVRYKLKFKSLDEQGGEVIQAFKGQERSIQGTADQTMERWQYGKIGSYDPHASITTKWGVSDIVTDVGWHFINREREQVGLRLRVIYPSGSTARAEYLFEPRIGTNRWGLGAGFDCGLLIWERDATDEISFHADAYYSYLFARVERRSFDLKEHGRGSRYMLLKQFNDDGTFNSFINGINVLTLPADSWFKWQVEGTLMFNLKFDEWTINGGYNIYGRGEENLSLSTSIAPGKYGIAGSNRDANTVTQSTATLSKQGTDDTDQTFITTGDLDIAHAQVPRMIQHTYFIHVTHTWEDLDVPVYIGVGAELALSSSNSGIDQCGCWARAGLFYS